MRVLFFTENLHSGGKERRIVELIKELTKNQNFEIELVLTRRIIHYKEIEECGIKIHFLERSKWKKDPSLFYKFYLIARRFKPDCIHVWGRMVAIYAIPTKRILRIPLINSEITDAPEDILPPELSLRLTMRYSDLVVSNSNAGIKAYNAPTSKSVVIYNGFDFGRLKNIVDKKTIRNELNLETEFVVIMIGTFYYKKDYNTYLNAAEYILENRDDITFLGIGSGDIESYKSLISEKNKRRIFLLPSRQNIESVMNIADVGVLATFTEGISNSILEFMALEKPVVVSGEGGCEELINNGENGYLLKPGSYMEMGDRICELIDNKTLRQKFSKSSKRIVKNRFSHDRMIHDFIKVYKKYEST